MDTWYYATADGQRHGPLPAAELRTLAAAGRIDARTLAWREGEAQWRPLQDFAGELGLPSLPPPLPQAAAAAAMAAPAPRRPGMSGGIVALLVLGAGVFLLMMVSILAAIALPAYHEYTLRAQVGQALAQAQALKAPVAEFVATHDDCPRNGDGEFGEASSYAQEHLDGVVFGRFDESGLCGLEATIAAPGKEKLHGRLIWLEYNADDGTWTCSSDLEDRLLPPACRG